MSCHQDHSTCVLLKQLTKSFHLWSSPCLDLTPDSSFSHWLRPHRHLSTCLCCSHSQFLLHNFDTTFGIVTLIFTNCAMSWDQSCARNCIGLIVILAKGLIHDSLSWICCCALGRAWWCSRRGRSSVCCRYACCSSRLFVRTVMDSSSHPGYRTFGCQWFTCWRRCQGFHEFGCGKRLVCSLNCWSFCWGKCFVSFLCQFICFKSHSNLCLGWWLMDWTPHLDHHLNFLDAMQHQSMFHWFYWLLACTVLLYSWT